MSPISQCCSNHWDTFSILFCEAFVSGKTFGKTFDEVGTFTSAGFTFAGSACAADWLLTFGFLLVTLGILFNTEAVVFDWSVL